MGIPSLHVEHAFTTQNPFTIHSSLYADFLAVANHRSLEAYADFGFDLSRIFVTGAPHADVYSQLKKQKLTTRIYIIEKYKFNPDRPIIVFGTTWHGYFTSFSDPLVFEKTIKHFFSACKQLFDKGIQANFVIKDRPQNAFKATTLETISNLAKNCGVEDFFYVLADTAEIVTIADVVVAVDSGLLIEALIAETPAINLMYELGLILGPCFDVNSGVIEVEPQHLACEIERLIIDKHYREQHVQQMRDSASYHNLGVDGRATERVAALMAKLAKKIKKPSRSSLPLQPPHYVWQALSARTATLDDVSIDYYSGVCHELIALLKHPPQYVLDMGCAADATGAEIKRQYPDTIVIGVELNQTAAKIAQIKLDQVIVESIEKLDFTEHAIPLNSIDTVFFGDVLEHLYNPWAVLENLKPYLTADAQVLVSLPNSRHFSLLSDLAHGNWTYREAGLLDVTHIRFFTLNEIHKFFSETGYIVDEIGSVVISKLDFIVENPQTHTEEKKVIDLSTVTPGDNLTIGKLTLNDLTEQDIFELQAFQILIRARPANNQQSESEKLLDNTAPAEETYATWRERHRLTPATIQRLLISQPEIIDSPDRGVHFFLFVYNDDDYQLLADTIDSLAAQIPAYWHLTIISPLSCPNALFETESMLDWVTVTDPTQFNHAIKTAFTQSPYSWLMIGTAGIRLDPGFICYLLLTAQQHSTWRCVYCDEDHLSSDGQTLNPDCKPAVNLELLRSSAYIGQAVLVHRELWQALETELLTSPRAWAFYAALRAIELYGNKGLGHIDELLLTVPEDLNNAPEDWIKTAQPILQSHLTRCGINASVCPGLLPDRFFVDYQLSYQPRVSILVAIESNAAPLSVCLDSILQNTLYPHYEIIIADTQLGDATTRESFAQLPHRDPRIQVIAAPYGSDLAIQFNYAAEAAQGEFFIFLTATAVIAQDHWVEQLLALAIQNDVGAVGCRVIDPQQHIIHAGVIIGMGNGAQALGGAQLLNQPGYLGRLQVTQEYSAVAVPGLCVRHDVFAAMGGFNQQTFSQHYYDVDLCLQLRQQGYRIIWTPHVTLIQQINDSTQDAASTAVNEKLTQQFNQRWLNIYQNDPAHHRYLSVRDTDWVIDGVMDVPWHPILEPLPRVVALLPERAAIEQRVIAPLMALTSAEQLCHFICSAEFGKQRVLPSATELVRARPTTLLVHRAFINTSQAVLADYAAVLPELFRVFTVEDTLLTLLHNEALSETENPKLFAQVTAIAQLCQRLIVPNTQAAKLLANFHSDIVVLPPYLPQAHWGAIEPRKQIKKWRKLRVGWFAPRFGWVGREKELAVLQPLFAALPQLAREIDWVFIGWNPPEAQAIQAEIYPHQIKTPTALRDLDLDGCVAPHLPPTARLMEQLWQWGAMGYAVLAAETPLTTSFPVSTIPNETAAWTETLHQYTQQHHTLITAAEPFHHWVINEALLETDDHLSAWLDALLAR
ncbi:glycosyltransferase [Thiospirillum jenense]|uniref:Glycosyltransferase n=1 Tax=Thiospirillum jenense TaxID=1653858 RepID=A0A839HGD9_9GAMM|nr:glycosyltransferase [Thiospirillum jenense]MBB1125989.1 glycosyltransferase [Thiospirillum jenense]